MLLALVLSLVLMPCHAMRCPTMPGDHTVRTGRAAHAGSEQTAWGPAGLHFFFLPDLLFTIYCICSLHVFVTAGASIFPFRTKAFEEETPSMPGPSPG